MQSTQETALQTQARITREKADRAFAKSEREWLDAHNAWEAEAKTLPSYKLAQDLFNDWQRTLLDFNRALQYEDQVNGTNYAPRNEVAA